MKRYREVKQAVSNYVPVNVSRYINKKEEDNRAERSSFSNNYKGDVRAEFIAAASQRRYR